MASDDVMAFQVLVPAGTPQNAPIVTATKFRASVVERITWHLPPGCAGLVGFQVSMRGVQVIPRQTGQFVIGDGRSGDFRLHEYPDSGDWSVTAYNTGINPHTIHIAYHIQTIRPKPHPLRLLPDAALSEYPDGDAAIYPAGMWG